jgi:hypothetical protein
MSRGRLSFRDTHPVTCCCMFSSLEEPLRVGMVYKEGNQLLLWQTQKHAFDKALGWTARVKSGRHAPVAKLLHPSGRLLALQSLHSMF